MHTLYIPKQYVFLDIFSTDIENNIQKKTNKKYIPILPKEKQIV